MNPKTKFFVLSLLISVLVTALSTPLWGQTMPYWRLRYAQEADGVTGNNTYATTVVVTNPNSVYINVILEDFSDINGNPMNTAYYHSCPTVTANASSITVQIAPYSACRLDTAWTGSLETGWLRVTETTNTYVIGGYLAYTYYLGSVSTGTPIFTVGISPTPIVSWFTVPVLRDYATGEDTAYSVVNPYSYSVSLKALLYDAYGNQLTWTQINLAPAGHRAQFFSELFPNYLASPSQFVGCVHFEGVGSTDAAIAAVLVARKGQFGGATATLDSIYSSKAPPRLDQEIFERPAFNGPNKDGGLVGPGIF